MPKESKELRELKRLMTGEMKEAVEQYQKASLNWICSSASEAEIDRKKRSLFMDYGTSFGQLYRQLFLKKGKFKIPDQEIRDYLEENDMLYLAEDYAHMAVDQGAGKKEEKERAHQELAGFANPGTGYEEKNRSMAADPLENADVKLNDDQKRGLRDFHKWLHRNCDKVGAAFLNTNGTMRNLADEFMRQPASIQLKTLYLLESQTRKNPDKNAVDQSVNDYIPKLGPLKDQMIASKWKFWKRTNGTQFYWHRLKESLDVAKELSAPEIKKNGPEHEPEENVKNGAEHAAGNGPEHVQRDPEDAAENRPEDMQNGPEHEPEKEAEPKKTAGEKLEDVISAGSEIVDTNIMGRVKDPHDAIGEILETQNIAYSGLAEKVMQGIGAAGAGLRSVIGFGALIVGIKDAAKARPVTLGIDRGAQGVGLFSDTNFVAASTTDAINNAVECMGMSIQGLEMAGSILTGVAGSAMLVTGGIDYISSKKRNRYAENAKEIGKQYQDQELEKLSELSEKRNKNNKKLSMGKMTQGALWAAYGFGTAFAVGVGSILAPVAGIAAVGVGVAAQAYEASVKRNIYRDTIDHDLDQNGTNIDKLDDELKTKLDNRRKFFRKGSKERERLDQMMLPKNGQKRKDIIRREKAAEKNCLTMEEYHRRVMDSIGDKIYEKCYKDGDHVIMEEEKDLYFNPEKKDKETQIRIGYKELQKSMGIRMDLPSKKSIAGGEKPETKKEKLKEGLSM